MTPWQIAKESESSQQIALFCFAAKAQKVGFARAMSKSYWNANELIHEDSHKQFAIPELKFLHHIPNGGSRGDTAKSAAIAGGRLKAEGVKAGVWDLCWPLKRNGYSGLYIEMKRPDLKKENNFSAGCSKEQLEFGDFIYEQDFMIAVCYDWLEAAKVLEDYYNLGK